VQKEEWDTMPFKDLDPEELTKEVNKYVKSIQQLEKGLPENKVVPALKKKVQKLRGQVILHTEF
jgi:dynein heavy chain